MRTEKVLVFDVDGTLFDTKPGIINALNEVLNTLGIRSIEFSDEDSWIGPPVRESFKKFAKMNDEQAEKATQLYRKIYVDKYISESTLYDGMTEVLEQLKKENVHVCIATMKTAEQIERLLTDKNMKEVFEIVQTAALDGSKTKADMLSEIKLNYGEKVDYFMIGDTLGDFEASKLSEVYFIAACYGYGFKNNLLIPNSNFKYFIHSPTDILNLI